MVANNRTDAVQCALCWRQGHVVKFCPYTVTGKMRQAELLKRKRPVSQLPTQGGKP